MQRYYQVSDFDGIDSYFNNLKSAKIAAEILRKEMIDGDWYGKIVITSFTLPKESKKELVVKLLNNAQFMVNRIDKVYFERL